MFHEIFFGTFDLAVSGLNLAGLGIIDYICLQSLHLGHSCLFATLIVAFNS
jgi:hypothetical protein